MVGSSKPLNAKLLDLNLEEKIQKALVVYVSKLDKYFTGYNIVSGIKKHLSNLLVYNFRAVGRGIREQVFQQQSCLKNGYIDLGITDDKTAFHTEEFRCRNFR